MPKKVLVTVEVDALSNNKTTMAALNITVYRGDNLRKIYNKKVTGMALRHPDDPNKVDVGLLLAIGRALEAVGARMQKAAYGILYNANLGNEKTRIKDKAKAILARK